MPQSLGAWSLTVCCVLWISWVHAAEQPSPTASTTSQQQNKWTHISLPPTTSAAPSSPVHHIDKTTHQTFHPSLGPITIPQPFSQNSGVSNVAQLGFDALFPTCERPCLNGGVCRMLVSNTPKCICPIDYKGAQCQIPSQPLLKFCDETTCRNGGTCTGTEDQPACACPPDVLGITCERRVRSYEVSLLVTNSSKPMQWNLSFTNPLSPDYKRISNAMIKAFDAACKLGPEFQLVRSYYGCEFLGFGNDSLNARMRVKFDLDDSAAQNVSESTIRQHILSGGQIVSRAKQMALPHVPMDFGALNLSAFTLKAINPCLSGNNDCSINAQCAVIAPGVYTCTCKAFTIDASLDKANPGRRCLYDGLIIFGFILVGSLVSMLIFLLCGCRRTIWYRYKNRGHPEHVTLVNMPSNYDI